MNPPIVTRTIVLNSGFACFTECIPFSELLTRPSPPVPKETGLNNRIL